MNTEKGSGSKHKPIRIISIGGYYEYPKFLKAAVSEMSGFSLRFWSSTCLNNGLNYLAENEADVIILDLDLPDSKGVNTFMRVRGLVPEIPIIVITSRENEEMSWRVIKEGAQDYIFRSQFRPSLLMRSLLYVVEKRGWEQYVRGGTAAANPAVPLPGA